jgi:thiol-disulfide isomerase/thioredoxin
MQDLLAKYLEKFAQSPNAQLVRKLQRELTIVGRPTPENWSIEHVFQGPREAGLGRAGTTVLLFWEVWCPHCRDEAPRMQELYSLLKESGLEIVGLTKVSSRATDEQVQAFIRKNGIEYTIAKEDGSVSKHFEVVGVPAAAVISNGIIIWRGHPARLSPELLMEWL